MSNGTSKDLGVGTKAQSFHHKLFPVVTKYLRFTWKVLIVLNVSSAWFGSLIYHTHGHPISYNYGDIKFCSQVNYTNCTTTRTCCVSHIHTYIYIHDTCCIHAQMMHTTPPGTNTCTHRIQYVKVVVAIARMPEASCMQYISRVQHTSCAQHVAFLCATCIMSVCSMHMSIMSAGLGLTTAVVLSRVASTTCSPSSKWEPGILPGCKFSLAISHTVHVGLWVPTPV
jgi:hypothetical protein